MTQRKRLDEKRKPGPKPGFKRAADPGAQAVPQDRRQPPRSVDIDSLSGDELRSYARRIGISPRDCEHLTEDRLRQNCKAFLQHHFELLTED